VAIKILVVDDSVEILKMLHTSLKLEGYEVLEALDGKTALALLEESIPDLIILDIFLPEMDGFEVCRRIREKGLKVPIIMLTAQSDVEQRIKGLKSGADDYLGKPFSVSELLERIRVQLRHLDEARLRAQELLKSQWDEINQGFKLAQGLQQPLGHSLTLPGLELGIQYLPVGKIGGDFYAIQETTKDRITIIIGDVVGKGVTASLLMASAFYLLHQLMMKNLSPGDIFTRANEILRKDLQEMESFVAAFCGTWDRTTGKLTFCNAGHQLPLLIRKKDHKHVFLNTHGFFLGAFPDGRYVEKEVILDKGDRLFFYTDGLSDLRDMNGRVLNLKWIYRKVMRQYNLKIEDISSMLLREIQGAIGKNTIQTDDVTFLLLEVDKSGPG
jgi:sigma-B regulation protein RsbU (phosphoserine phosphatase)